MAARQDLLKFARLSGPRLETWMLMGSEGRMRGGMRVARAREMQCARAVRCGARRDLRLQYDAHSSALRPPFAFHLQVTEMKPPSAKS